MNNTNKRIQITKLDQERLLAFAGRNNNVSGVKANIKILESKVGLKATDSKKIPPTVVTMNSRIKVKNLLLGKSFILELVYPKDVDVTKFKISVISPIGASMLGRREGDEFFWMGQNGKNRYLIEEILYQPEAAGDFHL